MTWHPHVLKMLRTYPNDPRTPDHLRPNKLMEEAADRIEKLEAELTSLAKRPVAWRVKDYADSWIIFQDEADANREAEATGALIQGLYVRDGT